MALAEALSRSPALLDDNLDAFEAEARRAFPAGADTWVLVSDVDGQQLLNTFAQPGQPLPRRNPLAIAAQRRAFSTRSIVISDLFRSPLTQDWIATYRGSHLQGRPALSRARHRHERAGIPAPPQCAGHPEELACRHHRWRRPVHRARSKRRGWPTRLSRVARHQRSNRGCSSSPPLRAIVLITRQCPSIHEQLDGGRRGQESGAAEGSLDHGALGGHAGRWPFCREPPARLVPGPTDHSADRSAAPGVCRRVRGTWQAD